MIDQMSIKFKRFLRDMAHVKEVSAGGKITNSHSFIRSLDIDRVVKPELIKRQKALVIWLEDMHCNKFVYRQKNDLLFIRFNRDVSEIIKHIDICNKISE